MLDKDHNKLDDLFRGKLRNDAAASNKWNVPPSTILDNALSAIEVDEPEKKRRWPVIFLFGIGLTMFMSIGYLFHQNQTMMKELDEKIEIINKAQQQNQASSPVESNRDKVIANAATIPSVDDSQKIGNNNSKITTSNTKSKATKKVVAPNVAAESHVGAKRSLIASSGNFGNVNKSTLSSVANSESKNSVFTNRISNRETPVVIKNNNTASTTSSLPSNSSNDAVVAIYGIPTLNLLLEEDFQDALPFSFVERTEKATYSTEKEGSKFSPFLLVGGQKPFFESMNNSVAGQMSNVRSHGVQVGFGTTYKLSKRWSLETSFAYERFSVNSTFEGEMVYDENQEFTDANGNKFYNMDINGSTPTHSTLQRLIIPVDAGLMQDGDVMLANTKTSSKFNIYRLQLGTRYLVGQFGKFDLYANGGLGANWTSSIHDEMDLEIMNEGTMMMKTTKSAEKVMNGFFASAYLGGQLNYRLSDQFHIGLNANFNKGFTNPNSSSVYSADVSKIGTLNSTIRFGYNF